MILPNLYHLKYFVDAVDCGSISGAADKNMLTHPAISRAIKALEDQFEVKLLVHKKKSFELTPDGLALAQRARELLSSVNHFNKDRNIAGAEPMGTVSLGLSRTIGQSILPKLFEELEKKYPKIKIKVHFGTTGEIIEKVANGSVDLGITIGLQKLVSLKQSLLKKGQFVLVSASSKKNGAEKEISTATFILTEPRQETELLKKEFYHKYKKPLLVKHEVSSWDMITQLVSKGHGIGLIPDISILSQEKPSLFKIKTDWFQCSYELYLHEIKVSLNSITYKSVLDLLKEIVKH